VGCKCGINTRRHFLALFRPPALSYKLIVIQKFKVYISKGSTTCRGEVILTILALADHEVLNVTGEKRKPFNTPLKNPSG
jgi:hypothetical protein